jgi:hypothetical protein
VHADLLKNETYRLWEACPNQPPCHTFHWAYDDWVCEAPEGCGIGKAIRPTKCIISSTGEAVNTTFCDPEKLETLTKPCELEPCAVFFWRARELTDCTPEDAAKLCGKVMVLFRTGSSYHRMLC